MKVKNKLGPAQPRPASAEAVYAARNAWTRAANAASALSAKWDYVLVREENMSAWMADCDRAHAAAKLCYYVERILRTDL